MLKVLKDRNIEIHTRTTFLQGLLLIKNLPNKFENIRNILITGKTL